MDPIFESFSTQHLTALIVFALFTFMVIWFGLNTDEPTKHRIGFGIAFIAFAFMVFDLVYRLATHSLDILKDLPLFLCDIVVIMLPVVIWKRNRKWIGILYFWAVAGTLQALITPELDSGFPSFEFFRYFIMHGGIVSVILYAVIVWKIKVSWRDFLNAILYAQFYIIGIHIINLLLGSNYSYTMRKPQSASILDLMGDWPWYILVAELVMVVLFLLLMLPFISSKREKSEISPSAIDPKNHL